MTSLGRAQFHPAAVPVGGYAYYGGCIIGSEQSRKDNPDAKAPTHIFLYAGAFMDFVY
nr:hypothetical protein [Maliibacterium massiliense]